MMAPDATGGPTAEPTAEVQKADAKGKEKQSAAAPAPGAKGVDGSQQPVKKMSAAAEAKAKKQAEKAARRAQAIAAKTPAAGPGGAAAESAAAQQPGQGTSESKGGSKTKGRQDGHPAAASGAAGRSSQGGKQAAAGQRVAVVMAEKDDKNARNPPAACFAHIAEPKRIPLHEADRDVHPSVLALGQQMASFTVRENIARLKATLQAFKEVIQSYEVPTGHSFSRHFLPGVLNPQIDYLTECRPMCFAMGNAIRVLKSRVADLDTDTPAKQAAEVMLQAVDTFQEKVHYAEAIITTNAATMISDGEVILTYGHHRLVRKAIRKAWSEGKRFKVAIVEDEGTREGRELAKLLRGYGLTSITYYPELIEVNALLRGATKVMLGVEAVFANGALYAPTGTSDIATAASSMRRPVIALCESVNVDRDRVAADALSLNEIEPEKSTELGTHLLFDTTDARHVSVLVTEYETDVTGIAPAAAAVATLRKLDEPN